VRRLCDGKYLNFLIADHFEFLCEICQVRPECGSLLLAALLRNAAKLNKVSRRHSILASQRRQYSNFLSFNSFLFPSTRYAASCVYCASFASIGIRMKVHREELVMPLPRCRLYNYYVDSISCMMVNVLCSCQWSVWHDDWPPKVTLPPGTASMRGSFKGNWPVMTTRTSCVLCCK